MKKRKKHLAGISRTVCGILMYEEPFAAIAKSFEEVDCKRCKKTYDYCKRSKRF